MELFKDRPTGCRTESLSMMLPLGNKIPFCGGGEWGVEWLGDLLAVTHWLVVNR